MAQYIMASCTDPGKIRDLNEDSMANFDSDNGRVIVICDGMGGQNAGDLASKLAVTAIQDILQNNIFSTPEEAISKSIIAANQAVLRRASQDESLTGMGTTCVMLVVKNGLVYYGSVGDSRIYYVANRMIRQITKDQSYVQTLVDAGQISQEQAEHHADKNQVTNAIGIENMAPPTVGVTPISPEPNSIFLLCSDGLSDMINNHNILGILSKNELSLDERARLLIQSANEAGGKDNITVQLLQFSDIAMSVPQNLAKMQKKNKGVILISICILFAVVLIGGGAYWYFNRNKSDNNKKTELPENRKESKESANQPTIKNQKTEVVVQEKPIEPQKDIKQVSRKMSKDAIVGKTNYNKTKQITKEIIGEEKASETTEEQIIQTTNDLSKEK